MESSSWSRSNAFVPPVRRLLRLQDFRNMGTYPERNGGPPILPNNPLPAHANNANPTINLIPTLNINLPPSFDDNSPSIVMQVYTIGKICKIKRKRDKGSISFEWQIPDFFTTTMAVSLSDYIWSPSFSFRNFTFRLAFSYRHAELLRFYIVSSKKLDHQLAYNLAIGKEDGTIENSISGMLKINETCSKSHFDVNYSDLRRRKSEFAPANRLHVNCVLRIDTAGSEQETKSAKLIKLEKLSDNFRQLFGDEDTCDTIVKVESKEFKVHRLVLIARCKVFAALFRHDTLEKQTGVITIEDCEPEAFKKFLEYLYCGKIEEMTFRNALGLYEISDKYDIEELREFCVEYLAQFLTVENFCEIALFAYMYDAETLMSSIQEFFDQNVNQILVTSEWKSMIETNFNLANTLLLNMPKAES